MVMKRCKGLAGLADMQGERVDVERAAGVYLGIMKLALSRDLKSFGIALNTALAL